MSAKDWPERNPSAAEASAAEVLSDWERSRLRHVENLVQQQFGLSPRLFGQASLLKILRQCCRRSGHGDWQNPGDWQNYLRQLPRSPSLLGQLVSALVVPETWFFRDRPAFTFLQQWAQQRLQAWATSQPGANQPLRFLSLPCSTGEEPYSMAIALLEAGLTPQQFRIDALDLSPPLLTQARLACYQRNAFRGLKEFRQEVRRLDDSDGRGRVRGRGGAADFKPRPWLQRYFVETSQGFQLCEEVRGLVQFAAGNILQAMAMPRLPYDGVFCRNLLIYFEGEARDRALQQLHRLVKSDGFVVFGAADINPLEPLAFERLSGDAMAYTPKTSSLPPSVPWSAPQPPVLEFSDKPVMPFANGPQPSTIPVPIQPVPIKPVPLQPIQDRSLRSQPARTTKHGQTIEKTQTNPVIRALSRSPLSQASASSKQTLLAQAQTAANRGELERALELCESYLQRHPLAADAYCLLGELHQALQQSSLALMCFQRSLYLDPNHPKALLHGSLLYEQQGRSEQAAAWRSRLDRQPDISPDSLH